eukprot:scaffold389095_cov31-Prasinocladus_malaysianus.AAC.1
MHWLSWLPETHNLLLCLSVHPWLPHKDCVPGVVKTWHASPHLPCFVQSPVKATDFYAGQRASLPMYPGHITDSLKTANF